MFGPNDFYNRRCLHQQAFTPKTFYTRGILQQRHFTPKGFLRQKVFTETFYTGGLLQQNMFTQCTYYTKQALCIKEFLHQKTLTPPSFVLESFFEMLNHKLFTPIHSHSKRLWQQRCTLYQRPFTPTNPYTRDLLHQKPFLTPGFMRFLFHQNTLTSETFHKQSAHCTPNTLRHQKTFTGETFCNNGSTKFYTGRLLC